jgi:hypothetical protein
VIFGLLSREAQVALLFAALVGCGAGGGGEPETEKRDVGWGAADTWHTQPVELVDDAAAAGLRFLVTEHFPTVQAADWRKGEPLESFPELAREWNRRACERGMIHIVFGANANVIGIRSNPDEWWREVVNEILSVYDPSCTWLEPIAEPNEGSREWRAKAQRWTQIAADAWPGRIILPGDGGAHWPIRHDFVDRHPGSVEDAERWLASGDPRLLVITDGGEFLPPTNVLADLPRLAGASVASGVPFIVYADRYAPGDPAAHRAIIRAIGGGG